MRIPTQIPNSFDEPRNKSSSNKPRGEIPKRGVQHQPRFPKNLAIPRAHLSRKFYCRGRPGEVERGEKHRDAAGARAPPPQTRCIRAFDTASSPGKKKDTALALGARFRCRLNSKATSLARGRGRVFFSRLGKLAGSPKNN